MKKKKSRYLFYESISAPVCALVTLIRTYFVICNLTIIEYVLSESVSLLCQGILDPIVVL